MASETSTSSPSHHGLDVDVCLGSCARPRKPHQTIFEAALDRLGLDAAPSEAVMVGDRYEDDIEGARASASARSCSQCALTPGSPTDSTL